MKVYTYIRMTLDGEVLEEEFFEYEGPVAKCDGSDSDGGYGSIGGPAGVGSGGRGGSMGFDASASHKGANASAGIGASNTGGRGGGGSMSSAERGHVANAGGSSYGASHAGVGVGGIGGGGNRAGDYTSSTGRSMTTRGMAAGQSINTDAAPGTTANPAGAPLGGYSSAGFAAHAANMAAARAAHAAAMDKHAGMVSLAKEAGLPAPAEPDFGFAATMGKIGSAIGGLFDGFGGMFSGFTDDSTSFADYGTRMSFMEQEKAYSNMAKMQDAAIAKAKAGTLSAQERAAMQDVMASYAKTYSSDLVGPQGLLSSRYGQPAKNLDRVSAVAGQLVSQVTGMPTDVPLSPEQAAGAMFDFVGSNVLGAVGTSLGGPVGGLIGKALGGALGSAVQSDVQAGLAAQDAMDALGLGSVSSAPSGPGVSAGADAGRGGGGEGRTNTALTTVKPKTTTPTTPDTTQETVTPTGEGELPFEDLLEQAWARYMAFQNQLGNRFGTMFYMPGPYALRREGLGAGGQSPDRFDIY